MVVATVYTATLSPASFTGREGEKHITISGLSVSLDYRYMYIGYGTYTSSTDYSYTKLYKHDGNSYGTSTQSYTASWDGDAQMSGTFTTYFSPPMQYGKIRSFTATDLFLYDTISNGSTLTWYFAFSDTSYSNDVSLFDKPDVEIYAISITVTNPPYINNVYHIYFKDGNNTIHDGSVTWSGSRDDEYTYPRSLIVHGCQNATQLGYTKPGYRGIGWDTSSSATTVVYGSKDNSGSFTIPANTLTKAGYNLYSVWERALNIKIYIGSTLRDVSRAVVVTNVSGTTVTTKDILTGKIYNGTSWKDF